MYKLHKIIIFTIFITMMCMAFVFELDYSAIAADTILVASILLGIYGISITTIINSPLVHKMRNTPDYKIIGSSKLGVLISYYKFGILVCFVTIFLGIMGTLIFYGRDIDRSTVYYFISSFSIALFFLNFICIYFIFKFIFNVQIRG